MKATTRWIAVSLAVIHATLNAAAPITQEDHVNEKGTEAAAVTVNHMSARSALMPVGFVCDRPFLFLIRAAKAGTILFVGRVNDPSLPAAAP